MKVYVHYEVDTPEHTFIYQFDEGGSCTIQQLLKAFVESYNQKHGNQKKLIDQNLQISNEKKKVLSNTIPLHKIVKDKEDLYVISIHLPKKTTPIITNSAGSQHNTSPSPTLLNNNINNNNNNNNKPPDGLKLTQLSDLPQGAQDYIKESLSVASQSVQKSNCRHAAAIYTEILSFLPNEKTCLLQLGSIYISAKKFDVAIQYLLKGLSTPGNFDIDICVKLGEAYFGNKQYTESAKYYATALSIAEKAKSNSTVTNKLKVLVGKALYAVGEQDTAIQIFIVCTRTLFFIYLTSDQFEQMPLLFTPINPRKENVLQEDEDHFEGLFEYGIALFDRSKFKDALRNYLRLLVMRPDSVETKEQIAKILSLKKIDNNNQELISGVQLLEKELPPNSNCVDTIKRYAFIATFIRDYGAIEESLYLYEKALQAHSDSSSYCLNYVHVLELLARYELAFYELSKFLQKNPTLGISDKLSSEQVLKALGPIGISTGISDHKNRLWQSPQEALSVPKSLFKLNPLHATKVDPQLKPYTNVELDFLALLCTAVKILYVLGALDLIPPFVDLIEPIREGRELHLTTIRNEHAYYCCIAQLMTTHTLPLVSHRPLYVAGDSHSMSPAWRTIHVKGEDRLLHPILVTGLKIWHLRPESNFYPKINFYEMINTIPKGSEVVFLFGEIDCREGLLLAVEKCKYKDLEEGISVTLDIYMGVLEKLINDYQFKIYIHPVLPVLNETRSLVKIFNQHLQTRVEAAAPRFQWLDFFGKLLTPDGAKLKSEYELDGTHINPSYLSLLEEVLNNM